MISQILHEIKTTRGAIQLNELKVKLGVERSALEGMIQHLVNTGHLIDDSRVEDSESIGNCAAACKGFTACPFTAKLPKTYSTPTIKQPAANRYRNPS